MATRFDKTNVNPDLAKERAKATFNTEEITLILDGGEWLTRKRREMELKVLNDKEFSGCPSSGPGFHFLSRSEKYEDSMRKSARYIKTLQDHTSNSRADSYFYSNMIFPNEITPIGLHSAMFMPSLESQCTVEQKAKWMKKAESYEIIGTYAQTELGHGTNVRGLETTATYDPKTQEFIIHSPTLTSTKWWPGGLGKTSNFAIVIALLYTQGVCHGTQAFIVQLRDMETHYPLSGITLGDIGPKFGFDTIDNGYLRFDHVRVPRDHMLMKYAQVTADGTFVKSSKVEKLSYGTMVFIRAMVVLDQAARGLAQASTIAIRYSCVRHQSEFKPGDPEPQIIEYQTQQYKLFPMLASAYAFWFAGLKMRENYFMLNYEIEAGNTESLPELHASSSGLKAFSTNGAIYGIEQCRLSCGGHGYSHASGLPKIYVGTTAACTYEGENTVLYLQTARYLVKAFQQAERKGRPLEGSVAYLSEDLTGKSRLTSSLDIDSVVDAYKHRAKRLIGKATKLFVELQARGKESYDAWNEASVYLVQAATAHVHLYVVQAFVEKIQTVSDDAISAVLTQLFKLYAAYGISNFAGDFIEDGYMSSAQLDDVNDAVLRLLGELRPNAVALVDSFDFTDHMLGSILGRYDGNVYENMYEWAANSPLNKTQVHESHKYLRALADTKSKL